MISFSKLNVLWLVAFIAGSTKISFVSLKTSLRWLFTFRFRKYCTWNLFSLKSMPFTAITSLYSWMKISPLAALNKTFSSLTYLLKSSWSNWSSVALIMQYKVSEYIPRSWEIISLAYSGAALPPKNYSILVGALFFLDNFVALTPNFVTFCFTASQKRWQFSSVLIFLSVATVCFTIV